MRNFVAGGLILAACSAMAGTFPYDVEMRVCNEAASVTVASLTEAQSVPAATGGVMGNSESVASVYLNDTLIQAMDAEDFETSTNAIGTSIHAALTLVNENDAPVWKGFTNGRWVDLTGFDAAEGTYDVKIDLDYSLSFGNGTPKIRYLIKETASTDYTELQYDSAVWMDIGLAGGRKIAGVDIYGFVTTGAASAQAGVRAAEGTFTKVEDVAMDYDTLKLKVTAQDTWGVNNIKVTLKDENGQAVGEAQTKAIAAGGTDFAFTVTPGQNYTYEVQMTGSYGGQTTQTAGVQSESIPMFSSDDWFYFKNTDPQFVRATSTGITIEGSAFHATDEDVEGKITPEPAPENVGVVVTTTMEIQTACTTMPTFEDDAPQFAIALGEENSGRVWKYFAGGEWHNGASGLPTENGTYEGRATFDYTNHVVKYEIRPENGVFAVLAEKIALPFEKTALEKVGICGSGNVTAMNAQLKLAAPPVVKPTGDTIELTGNANVDLSKMSGDYTVSSAPGKKCHLKWTDANNKFAKMDGNKLQVITDRNPANGLSSYNSYVLGLDADTPTDKPAAIIKPGTDEEETVKVYVPNITVNEECGYTVKLLRQKSTDGGANWIDDDEFDVNAEVPIPFNTNTTESAGILYRVNTILK